MKKRHLAIVFDPSIYWQGVCKHLVDNAPSVGIVSCSKNPVDAREKNIQQRAKSLSLAGALTTKLVLGALDSRRFRSPSVRPSVRPSVSPSVRPSSLFSLLHQPTTPFAPSARSSSSSCDRWKLRVRHSPRPSRLGEGEGDLLPSFLESLPPSTKVYRVEGIFLVSAWQWVCYSVQ